MPCQTKPVSVHFSKTMRLGKVDEVGWVDVVLISFIYNKKGVIIP